jgi:hypothetical protein
MMKNDRARVMMGASRTLTMDFALWVFCVV